MAIEVPNLTGPGGQVDKTILELHLNDVADAINSGGAGGGVTLTDDGTGMFEIGLA